MLPAAGHDDDEEAEERLVAVSPIPRCGSDFDGYATRPRCRRWDHSVASAPWVSRLRTGKDTQACTGYKGLERLHVPSEGSPLMHHVGARSVSAAPAREERESGPDRGPGFRVFLGSVLCYVFVPIVLFIRRASRDVP